MKLTRFLQVTFVLCVIAAACVIPWGYIDWYDNVVINEMARGGITGKLNVWTVVSTGRPQLDSQTWAIYYLGGWFVERAYCLMGHWGPRILMLVAQVLASLLCVRYLRFKTGKTAWAWLLGLLYLTIPLIQVSVRSARVDALSLLFVWAALCLLQGGERRRGLWWTDALAGGLFAAAVFTWISAVMVAPLLLWEWIERQQAEGASVRKVVESLSATAAGAGLMAIVLLSPFLLEWQTTLANFQATLAYNTAESKGAFLGKKFILLAAGFPGFMLFGMVLLFTRRRFVVPAVGLMVCALVCMMTKVIATRFYYFLPYAMVGAGVGILLVKQIRLRQVLMAVVWVMTFASVVRTGIVRNGLDFLTRSSRDYAAVTRYLLEKVGREAAVYTDSFELYYVGRELDWRQFRVESQDENAVRAILEKCSWYVNGPCSLKTLPESLVLSCGFVRVGSFCTSDEITGRRANPQLGPFVLYRREGDAQ